MDSLRPDRDDLDLYNSRKNKSKSAKSTPGKGSARSKDVSATRVAASGEATQGTLSSSQAGASSRSPLLVVSLLLMMLALAGLSYFYRQQSQSVMSLEKRLASADEFIGQSKLLFARLEGEVNENGAKLMQTRKSEKKKKEFMESEVRKL